MMKTYFGRVAIAAFLQLVLLVATARAQALRISNLQNGQTLRYPVALIAGQVDLPDGTPLSLHNESSEKTNSFFATSIIGGRFKALMELMPGENQLLFASPLGQQTFKLRYEPMTNPLVVRVIYVVDPGGDTRYPTQFPNDPQNFRAKLQTAARLIQTLTAETMNESGWGRKTFRLEEDARGEVIVHTLRAPREAAYYQGIGQDAVGGVVRDFVNPAFPTQSARNLVINNLAGYDGATQRTLGHCANSADGSAVFGALDIFSWPGSLQEVQRALSSTTFVDPTQVSNDSNGRDRLWAVASTTIGVTLHELGHCFNIPHSGEQFGIMARGHDFFNRNFTLIEPPIPGRERFFAFPDDQRARFETGNAARLAYHPFFQPDKGASNGLAAPSIDADFASGDLSVRAPAGLRALSIERDGLLRETLSFRDEAPTTRVFSRAELGPLAGGANFALVAIDDEGRGTFRQFDDLLDQRPFVRSWHLSPLIAWPDTSDFPKVSAMRLRELTEQTAAREARLSFSPLFDIGGHLRGTGDTNRHVAYAYRAIECEGERRVLLLTGSDDALRIWVNGQLVTEKGVFREAKIDEDQSWITLKPGHNDVLVEVVNVGGGWGFYLRMVDETNTFLHLAPDGRLARLTDFYDPKRFARAWQIAADTAPWPSPTAATDREPARAVRLETELKTRPVEAWQSPFIDLRARYQGQQPVEARVSTARTTLKSDLARTATLLTGSDDTIRVWLNGALVLERLSGRAAQPDDDQTSVNLRAGKNQILVECGTGDGGWGFYLRLEENGAPLYVREDGTLSQKRD